MTVLRALGRSTLAVGTAGLLALAASASGAEAKTTLTFANWADAEGATRPGIQKVIQDYQAQHPDIEIKSEAISFSEIAHQLVLRTRAGNVPDIAEIAGDDTFLLSQAGGLEPLGAYVTPALKAKLKPSALDGFMKDGKLIAFPWTEAPAGFWYNKAMLQAAGLDPAKPPATVEELMNALAAIKKAKPDVIPLGIDTTNRSFALTSNWPWMATFGANPLANGGDGAAAPEMQRYLAWMRDLAKKGYMDPNRKIGEFRPLAAQGKIAFTWDQVLLQGVIQSTNKMPDADFYNSWGVTTLPVGPGGKPYSFEGGHQLVIFAKSSQKQAAWDFVTYLATSPAAISGYTLSYESSLPPVNSASDPALAAKLDTPVFKAFAEKIAPTVVTPPYGAGFAPGSNAIMAGVQQAVTSDQPIDAIAKAMQQQLKTQ
jgi:multiple sugar transport system substrate-binding protein